jgi:hypothetical protein
MGDNTSPRRIWAGQLGCGDDLAEWAYLSLSAGPMERFLSSHGGHVLGGGEKLEMVLRPHQVGQAPGYIA